MNKRYSRYASQDRARAGAGMPAPVAGFTLIEMLIALVLSGIIFITAYQVISNLIQYQVRARVQQSAQMDKILLQNMLSQLIEKSIFQYELFFNPQDDEVFSGERDSLQLVSSAYNDRFDKPGYRVYRLYEKDGELNIEYRAYDQDYRSHEIESLATGLKIESISFAYLAAGSWVDEWPDRRSIPGYIRIRVDYPGQGTEEWIRGTSRR